MTKRTLLVLCASMFLFANTGWSKSKETQKTLRPLFEKYNITAKNQGARPTCSVFTLIGLIEFEYANTLGQTTPLSVEYLNWASNQITGEAEDGSFFDVGLEGMRKYGVCSDAVSPYQADFNKNFAPSDAATKDAQSRKSGKLVWIKKWNPDTGITDKMLAKIQKELVNEHPVAIGFRWPKSHVENRYLEGGTLAVQTPDNVVDGHSVLIVGFKDDASFPGGGYLIFKNSYGTSFGDGGYGKIPYEYAMQYANDAVTLRVK